MAVTFGIVGKRQSQVPVEGAGPADVGDDKTDEVKAGHPAIVAYASETGQRTRPARFSSYPSTTVDRAAPQHRVGINECLQRPSR
jgi:hypothetical protein